MLERLFDLRGRGTTVRTEVLAGLTTFVTMDKFGPSSEQLLALNPAATDAAANTAAAEILGDAVFGESARLIARTLSQHQPKIFFYLFSRGVAGRAQVATHSEVLPFVFGSLDKPSFIPHAAATPGACGPARTPSPARACLRCADGVQPWEFSR